MAPTQTWTVCALWAVALVGTAAGNPRSSIDTVVLLVVDDLGTADLGLAGSRINTPHLDALAAGGTVLTNYYVMRACSPTRAALQTGRYTIRYGFQSGVLEPAKPYGLALNETLLPQHLARHGFVSHAVGKWHLGHCSWAHTPTFRGYSSFYGYYTGAEGYYSHANPNGGFDFRLDARPNCGADCSHVAWEDEGLYSTHLLTARTTRLIEAWPAAQKLFLYLPYQSVHEPAEVPDSYKTPYSFADPLRNTFAGMLSCLDEGVGNVTAALKAKRRWESTLFVVTTDNGAPTTGCGGAQGGQNWPHRGGKCSAWEGGLRGVSFAHGPGILPGRRIADLAHAVDWLPTIISFVGGSASSGVDAAFPLDGIDLRPALTGTATAPLRDTLLLESDPYSFEPKRRGDESFGGDMHATPYYAVRHQDWKLIIGDPGQPGILDAFYCTGPPCASDHNNSASAASAPSLVEASVQLFNITSDPTESTNLAAGHPDVVKMMTALVKGYNRTAVSSAQQGLPDDPRASPALHNNTIAPWL